MTAQNPPTYGSVGEVEVRPSPETAAQVLSQAFIWMFAGLLVTAVTTFLVNGNESLQETIAGNWLIAFLVQVGLALAIQGLIRRLNPIVALGLFFVFAVSVGLTIGVIVGYYTQTSVATAFLSAASIFGGAALYGYTTKRPLTKYQQYIPLVIFGWIAAVVINIVIGGGTFSLILSLITVVLFTALTAYDVKRLVEGDYITWTGSPERAAVLGATHLYVNFINIFVSLLNLLGDRD